MCSGSSIPDYAQAAAEIWDVWRAQEVRKSSNRSESSCARRVRSGSGLQLGARAAVHRALWTPARVPSFSSARETANPILCAS